MLDNFVLQWAKFDEMGFGFIHTDLFPDLMFELNSPMGWDMSYTDNPQLRKRFMKQIKIKTRNGLYYFNEVLEGIALRMIAMQQVSEQLENHMKDIQKESDDSDNDTQKQFSDED
jgi:hypothetical protein